MTTLTDSSRSRTNTLSAANKHFERSEQVRGRIHALGFHISPLTPSVCSRSHSTLHHSTLRPPLYPLAKSPTRLDSFSSLWGHIWFCEFRLFRKISTPSVWLRFQPRLCCWTRRGRGSSLAKRFFPIEALFAVSTGARIPTLHTSTHKHYLLALIRH